MDYYCQNCKEEVEPEQSWHYDTKEVAQEDNDFDYICPKCKEYVVYLEEE